MIHQRQGHSRLTKDLLRDLLRELYQQQLQDEAEPVKRAEREVTSKEVAQWLREQGAVAADLTVPASDRLAKIHMALLNKVDELGLSNFYTEAHSKHVVTMLGIIFGHMDADVYHAGLRERVITYICKEVLHISPEDGSDAVQQTLGGIDKALTLLRVGEIDTYKTLALLIFHIGWLACALDSPYRTLVMDMPKIETRLWELISPYHIEP